MVGVDGAPRRVCVLEVSSAQWAVQLTREMAGWHFRPGTVNGIPAETNGILEINRRASRGEPSARASTERPNGVYSSAARGFSCNTVHLKTFL
jgi:hypothetical protein